MASYYKLTNDRLLREVLPNNQVVEKFPFLKEVKEAAPPEGCIPCQAKKYEKGFRNAAEEAKGRLASLSPEDATELKQLLNLAPGTKIRIWYITAAGTKEAAI